MQQGRFFLVAMLVVALAGIAFNRGLGAPRNPLTEAAQWLETAVAPSPLLPSAAEPEPTPGAKRREPGIAAFAEIEGSLFQILVGRDREGEPWSAAVSDDE